MGKSRSRITSKILALTDGLGTIVYFVLLPGQRHDMVGVPELIADHAFGAILADKAFDAAWVVDEMEQRGAEIVISQRLNRKAPRQIDKDIYKWRHLFENCFGKIKEFKRIAMPACKTDTSFSAMIYITAAIINSR